MGKRKRQTRNDKGEKRNRGETTYVRDPYEKFIKENASFERYYKAQNIVPQEEWDQFIETLKKQLPIAFRISGSKKQAEDIKAVLTEKYVSLLQDVEVDGEKLDPPHHLPFYPNQMAWAYNASRQQIRKSDLFKEFHGFLVSESEVGNLTRQEAVSMIPPLLLDIHSDHFVLDMCAAPGSKTSQLVEMLHAECDDGVVPKGLVVANDADHKRSYLLVHQMKRLLSPCLLVTNHDATLFPAVMHHDANGERSKLKFDRILADVPCSGDGTMRKNPAIWSSWATKNGNALHGVQVNILCRAFNLLKPGGRVVYSTCSLNPIENEAVIAEILRRYPGRIKVLDMSDALSGLKREQGLTEWKAMDNHGEWIESESDLNGTWPKSFLPPAEEEIRVSLKHCMRVLPHAQNTGGFFIAVLEKKGDDAGTANVDVEDVQVMAKVEKADTKKTAYNLAFRDDPFHSLDETSELVQEFIKTFEVTSEFPAGSFMVRSENGRQNAAYMVSSKVRDIVNSNEDNLKIVNAGIKAFCRHGANNAADKFGADTCTLRLHSEFLSILFPYVKNSSRVIDVPLTDLLKMLPDNFPLMSGMGSQTQQRLEGIAAGGAVVVHYPNQSENDFKPDVPLKYPIVIPIWRAKTSVNVMLDKHQRLSLASRLMGANEAKKLLSGPIETKIAKEGEAGEK